jgi:thiosulfate/3-mercaptopyruvate sulfurtransferase
MPDASTTSSPTASTYPLLLEPDALDAALGDANLLIVDLCQPQTWQQMHVPGAVHVNPGELVSGIAPATGKLPELQQLERLFARIGYAPERHIVAYDDEGGGWAGRFLWTLDVIGHTRYSYLNGGLHAWYKEGHPVTSEVAKVTPSVVNLTLHQEPIAEIDTVMAALGNPAIRIWDARSREEYLGLRSGSARAGHIPGAVNLDWLELMDREHNLRLLPADVLRRKLAAIGIAPQHHIITHCQTHHRSGLTYLAAKVLGMSAQGYHGSWGEWGNLPDTPIEQIA